MSKTFSTLAVASCATGIGLGGDLTYALMGEISGHVLGHPVWTHELGDKATTSRVKDAIRLQFPNLPTEEEARADWQAAGAKAVATYGDNIEVAEGSQERTEDPIQSLVRMTGRTDNIIAVVVGDEKS